MPGHCEIVQENLLPYVDGEVLDNPELKIEEHLKTCPACRQQYESILALQKLFNRIPRKTMDEDSLREGSLVPYLMGLPRQSLPAAFEEQVLQALRAEIPIPAAKPRRRGIFKVLQPLAAAAAVVGISSIFGYHALATHRTAPRNLDVDLSFERPLYFHTLKEGGVKDAGSYQPGSLDKRAAKEKAESGERKPSGGGKDQ